MKLTGPWKLDAMLFPVPPRTFRLFLIVSVVSSLISLLVVLPVTALITVLPMYKSPLELRPE